MPAASAPARRGGLPLRFVVASLFFVGALFVFALVSAGALTRAGGITAALADRQIASLALADRLDDVLVEKGLLANYLATKDVRWRDELARRQQDTRRWLEELSRDSAGASGEQLVTRLREAYARYDELRGRCLSDADAGRTAEALAGLESTHQAVLRVRDVAHELAAARRADLEATLSDDRALVARSRLGLALLAVVASLLGMLFGVWSARRISRPLSELIVRLENSDPERLRVEAVGSGDELVTLRAHVERLLARLDEQRRRLAQTEKMRALGEIAAKLAHEILNPVAGAKAALQALDRTNQLPELPRTTLREIDRTLSRVDAILERLVRFARPLEPQLSDVQVDELVSAAIDASAPELSRAQVQVVRAIDPVPAARLDRTLVAQVLTNLVTNAAQHSPAGAAIRISARRDGHQLVIDVDDQGRGLPPERDRLFRPFFTTRPGGHGLGLAMCQNVVAEHGGTIVASDNPAGQGARFTVTLPQEGAAWPTPS